MRTIPFDADFYANATEDAVWTFEALWLLLNAQRLDPAGLYLVDLPPLAHWKEERRTRPREETWDGIFGVSRDQAKNPRSRGLRELKRRGLIREYSRARGEELLTTSKQNALRKVVALSWEGLEAVARPAISPTALGRIHPRKKRRLDRSALYGWLWWTLATRGVGVLAEGVIVAGFVAFRRAMAVTEKHARAALQDLVDAGLVARTAGGYRLETVDDRPAQVDPLASLVETLPDLRPLMRLAEKHHWSAEQRRRADDELRRLLESGNAQPASFAMQHIATLLQHHWRGDAHGQKRFWAAVRRMTQLRPANVLAEETHDLLPDRPELFTLACGISVDSLLRCGERFSLEVVQRAGTGAVSVTVHLGAEARALGDWAGGNGELLADRPLRDLLRRIAVDLGRPRCTQLAFTLSSQCGTRVTLRLVATQPRAPRNEGRG